MKETQRESLGFKVKFSEFESLDEAIKSAGAGTTGQAVVLKLVNNALARAQGINASNRIVEAAEAVTQTKAGEDEGNEKFIARLVALDGNKPKIQDAIDKAGAIVLDLSPRPPAQKGKLGENARGIAREYLGGKRDLKKLNLALTKAGIPNFTAKGDDTDVDRLGWLLKAYKDSQDPFPK